MPSLHTAIEILDDRALWGECEQAIHCGNEMLDS